MMHLVFRLTPEPLTVCSDPAGSNPRVVGHSLIGGARSSYYVRDVSAASHSVGAVFHPGTAPLLLGIPASELAERHSLLDDLWGHHEVTRIRGWLAEAGSPERELTILETVLAARLPRVRALHPAVSEALACFAGGAPVGEVVKQTGYSHRTFLSLFHDAVGLTPKVFCRVTRVQRAADLLRGPAHPQLAEVALTAGYADQAHCSREFSAIAGISPARYRTLAPRQANHVPIVPPTVGRAPPTVGRIH